MQHTKNELIWTCLQRPPQKRLGVNKALNALSVKKNGSFTFCIKVDIYATFTTTAKHLAFHLTFPDKSTMPISIDNTIAGSHTVALSAFNRGLTLNGLHTI